MKDIDVSIIIVNWNTRELVCDCIESVYKNTATVQYEIIVIDNASKDGSLDAIEKKFPQVRLIKNFSNRGFAAGNNQGMTVAKGRYILLLNSDTLVLERAIDKAVEFADTQQDIAVTGCRVLNSDQSLQPTCFMFPSIFNMVLSSTYLYKIFPKSKFFGRERMTWWNRDDVRQVDVVTGCFMLVRRQAIEQVGAMDERFFMYGEETDWCCRFKKAGWKVMFTPDAEIIHFGGQSSKIVREEMFIQLRLSILKFIEKHHGQLAHKTACLLTAMFFALRMPVWFFASFLTLRDREYASARLRTYLKGVGRVLFNS